MENAEADGANEPIGVNCWGCGLPIENAGGGVGSGRRRRYHGPQCRLVGAKGVAAALSGNEKRAAKKGRLRIDPTTCDRQYDEEETAFLKAVDRYRREAHRPFPGAVELLQIAISLGYRRCEPAGPLPGVAGSVESEVRKDGSD